MDDDNRGARQAIAGSGRLIPEYGDVVVDGVARVDGGGKADEGAVLGGRRRLHAHFKCPGGPAQSLEALLHIGVDRTGGHE